MSDDEIKAIAQRAATEAVEEMLRRLNLHDDNSAQDVHDLRGRAHHVRDVTPDHDDVAGAAGVDARCGPYPMDSF